jgi:hypothetical protein
MPRMAVPFRRQLECAPICLNTSEKQVLNQLRFQHKGGIPQQGIDRVNLKSIVVEATRENHLRRRCSWSLPFSIANNLPLQPMRRLRPAGTFTTRAAEKSKTAFAESTAKSGFTSKIENERAQIEHTLTKSDAEFAMVLKHFSD